MRRTVLCLSFLVLITMTIPGCETIKSVLKTVAISTKINEIAKEENAVKKLMLLKDLVEESRSP